MLPEIDDLAGRALIIRTGLAGQCMTWRVWGEGPPLVLLHGGHGSWLHWLRNIDALSKHYRLYLPNLPGFGGSDPLPEASMSGLCKRLLDAFDALHLPEKFYLGGFSFGCFPACSLLPQLSHRIERLFLIGAGGFGGFRLLEGLKRWQDVPRGPERDAISRNNLAILMIHDPAKIDDLSVHIQGINAEGTTQDMRPIVLVSDQRVLLAAHPVPMSVIWGTEDALSRGLFDERVTFLKNLQSPAEVVFVPDSGHWVQYETPEAVNDVLIAALMRDRSGGLNTSGPQARLMEKMA